MTDTYRQLNLFGDVFERVRSDYVEAPDDGKLVESAVNGMLASLDPHSSYMDAKSFQDMQVQTRGEFGGLGIEVTMEDNVLKVVTPIDETPAAKAGVRAGDVITALDGESVQGLTLQQAVDKMRGPVNSPIIIKVTRAGTADPIDIKLVRDVIRIKSVRSKKQGDDIGYIRITQFTEQTFDGLKKAIEDLNKEIGPDKLKGYVIDLRNNPGGLLDQAIAVSDAFLERGEIVSTRGRQPGRHPALHGPGRRPRQRQAGDRAGQWRLGLGVRDRRRRPAGPQARDHPGHALLRQGLGADDHPAQRQWRAAADHGALLHAVRPLDPGQGHRAGDRGQAERARRPQGQGRDQGRGRAEGPSRQFGREGRGRRLLGLCAAGREGRHPAQRGAGASARHAEERLFPARPESGDSELVGTPPSRLGFWWTTPGREISGHHRLSILPPETPMPALADLLAQKGVLLADGATGTNLFEMGLMSGDPPEMWNLDHPDRITALHQSFVDAGADIILTNSFGGNRRRLALHKLEGRVRELNARAAGNARAASPTRPAAR